MNNHITKLPNGDFKVETDMNDKVEVDRHNLALRCVAAVEQAHAASAWIKTKLVENILHSTWVKAGMADALARENSDYAEATAQLQAERDELVDALEIYADTLCEEGKYSEVCGRLSDIECFGCRARALLTKIGDAK